MKDQRSLCEVFLHGIAIRKPDRILYKPRGSGDYRRMSSDEFADRVLRTAAVMEKRGVARGDRVAILSYNRPEWAVVDYASLVLGAVTVPIYSTLPADQVAYILNDCGAELVFVEDAAQHAKAAPRACISFEPTPGVARLEDECAKVTPLTTDDARRRAASVKPDELATLIYTSGTTGEPKGVMLSHENLVSNLIAAEHTIHFAQDDVALSFLPLSHSFERLVDYALFFKGATVAYAESTDTVAKNVAEVRPTIMAAVPRVYEKFHAKIVEGVRAKSSLAQALFRWAMTVGALEATFRQRGRKAPLGLRFKRWLAHALVLRKVHAKLGGRMRLLISGGAALPQEIGEFFWALGFTLLEGYGLTETSPVIAVNAPGAARPGTVGRVIEGVEVKIAEDGEILCRGPNVMKGYFKRPSDTQRMVVDGWLSTGDIGEVDAEGFLHITDRKKDLLKTSGGKYVAPAPIESRLKMCPGVLNAVVIGDGKKFPSALIVAAPGATREQIQKAVDEVNRTLAHHEAIKKFELVTQDFTIEGGELTPTMKVKRRVVERKYAALIERIYAADNGA